MAKPKYRLMTPHFFEPDVLKADTVIEYEGPPNEGMEPLNDEAIAALNKYFEKHPRASITPVDQLPLSYAATVMQDEAIKDGVRKINLPQAEGASA